MGCLKAQILIQWLSLYWILLVWWGNVVSKNCIICWYLRFILSEEESWIGLLVLREWVKSVPQDCSNIYFVLYRLSSWEGLCIFKTCNNIILLCISSYFWIHLCFISIIMMWWKNCIGITFIAMKNAWNETRDVSRKN